MKKNRGFVILIAVLVSSLLISIGTFISIVALKEIRLSTSSKDSQIAFYAADSAIECALYFDLRSIDGPFPKDDTDTAAMASGGKSDHLRCNGEDIQIYHAENVASAPSDMEDIRSDDTSSISYFEVSFARDQQGETEAGAPFARVRIYKHDIGTANDETIIRAWGHNKKSGVGIVERALEVTY